ncbi:MAG: PAS domain S-box protein [Candidatus Competibacteraceae bacterium]|nr:PAS domain S-box protein [Candidatus Competibacteraceae bacterium]MCB1820332.1 PAS domain S-box protein [Candidatus Competibacteraceae bacterium]
MTDYSKLSCRDLVAKLRAAEAELRRIKAIGETENRRADSSSRLFTATELRHRAETQWQAQRVQTCLPLAETESQWLIHELHVHQTELELQNEELQEVNARLQQSLERYTDLYDFAPAGYFTLTDDGVTQEVNLTGAVLLGQQRSSLIGRRLGLFVAEDSQPTFNTFLDQLMMGISPGTCEVTLDLENASSRQVRFEGASIDFGMDRRCRLIAVDITRYKQMEQERRAREQQLSAFFRAVPAGMGVTVQRRFQQANDYFFQALGYRPDEIIGQSTRIVYPSDEAFERIHREIQNQIEQNGLAILETQTRCKDGQLIDIILQVAPLTLNQPESGWVFVAVDITEHKQMMETLRQVKERLELVIAGADVGLYDVNLRTGKAVVNERYLQILDYAPGEMVMTVEGWRNLIHPDDLPRVDRACEEAKKTMYFNEEYRMRHKSGNWIWVLDRGKGFDWDEHGNPWRLAGTHLDISARKHAEQTLLARETLLRTIMENSPDPIFMMDRASRLLYANPAALAVLNAFGDQPLWTQETLIGKTPLEFFGDPAVGQAILEANQQVIASGQTTRIEERITTQDATRIYLSTRSPLWDSAGQIVGLVGIAHNITEQKHGEEQRLAQLASQRDTLVQEVHHRIKNHLQGVTGLLRNRIARHPELAEDLEAVIAQICAIAHVYGLQSHRPEGRVRLDALLKTLADRATGVAPIHCALPVLKSGATVSLAREEAVPLALVINELLTNALKHNDTTRPTRPIQVALEISATEQRVVIRNGPALLTTTFDFAAGRGLGTGLELLQALLPPQGAALTFGQQGDEVVTELRLTPPVVNIEIGAGT